MKTVPGPTDRVVVVGAGLGGLSAAVHLAAAGRQVTMIEREPVPGGRAGLLEDAGYRFDTGPTVLTMPSVLDEVFASVGERREDWLELRRLDPAYRARFADGSVLDLRTDPEQMAEQIRAICGAGDAAGYLRFVGWLEALYQTEWSRFIDRNLDSVRDLGGRPLLDLIRLGGFRRLSAKVGDFLEDERLRRIFTFQSMYAGLAPAQALALYGVITYLDSVQGVYFPVGGVHAVPVALADVATKYGVEIRYSTRVTRIVVEGRRASGVVTDDGDRIAADVVVVNADRPVARQELLGETPHRARPLRYSPSAVVLHVGSGYVAPEPVHHTISFGSAWEQTFDEVIRGGRLMSDPSFLLTNPTVTDPSIAPAGRQAYYALFPAPNLDHRMPLDWQMIGDRYQEQVLRTIEARGFAGFSSDIETIAMWTPADWAARGLAAGTPFAAAHSFGQTGPFRPGTFDRRIENLLYCGSNVQPGVGVPMVLISGKLAAARVTSGASR